MATENPRVWFKSISLENVRSFGTKQTIDFTDKDGNAARWNVILGDNGTGKTTVLKALVMASADFSSNMASGPYYYHYYLRKSFQAADISADYQLNDIDIWHHHLLIRWENGVFKKIYLNESIVSLPIVLSAYGANRRIDENSTLQVGTEAKTLFDENAQLIGPASWLMEAEYISLKKKNFHNRYTLVKSALLKLFRNEISDIEIKVSESANPNVFFKTHYGEVRLQELSLGYKTLIAWMVDFAKGLFDRYPDSENPLAEPAICLVDEIDLHLHPKFQRTIIKFLTDTFPNTQFIVTAHSPLIVQSAGDANIILLKREGDETHVADGIDVHSWRIDQILSSDLFGGIGGRAPQIEEKMARRRALIRKDERTPEEIQELDILEKELNELPVMETREALKAIDIISKAVITEG